MSGACNVLDHIHKSIIEYRMDFGRDPEGLFVGPDVATHIWEHVKDGVLKNQAAGSPPQNIWDLKEPMFLFGIRVQIIAVEGLVTFPMPFEFISTWLKIMNEPAENEHLN